MIDPLTLVRFLMREYPLLIRRLQLLKNYVKDNGDKRIAAIILFGSIARLTASPNSDTDLLVLLKINGDRTVERDLSHHFYRVIERAEKASGNNDASWHIVPITGDITGNDLDADFLAQIGEDGVLLYHRRDTPLPSALRHLTSFVAWQKQATTLVETLEHALNLADNKQVAAIS